MAKKKSRVRPLNAAQMGKLGGKARAASMTPEQRKEAAKKAIRARWDKHKNNT